MKSHTDLEMECNYSFEMLYEAAFGKSLPLSEKEKLQDLPQNKINALVEKWARLAGWKTLKKRGTDNILYLSFHP